MERTSCPHCGAAPAPHLFLYLESTLSILTERYYLPLIRPFVYVFGRLADWCTSLLIIVLRTPLLFLGVLSFTDDSSRVVSKRTKVVWEEAKRRGIRMEILTFLGKPREQARAKLRGKKRWMYFESVPIPETKDLFASSIDDKSYFKSLMQKAHLPTPKGGEAVTLSGARRLWKELGVPVIVKPREGSRARHTTVDIRSEKELEEGFKCAQQICMFVVVEEFVTGPGYRALCVGGKVAGVMHFVKPSVVGDGVHTIDELRKERNQHKTFRDQNDTLDTETYRRSLTHQGHAPESVPARGVEVIFTEQSEVLPNGGYYADVTDAMLPARMKAIEEAARVCGLAVIGFDIISKDLTNESEPYYFIEGNTLPFIELHHEPHVGTPRNVAGMVWDLWEQSKDSP